jgi:hypothetical protein
MYLDIEEMTRDESQQITALHCFVESGPYGEQGTRKKMIKEDVMESLNYWILTKHFRSKSFEREVHYTIPGYDYHGGEEVGAIYNLSAASTITFLTRAVDNIAYERMKTVWLDGNFSAHVNTIQKLTVDKLITAENLRWEKMKLATKGRLHDQQLQIKSRALS